MVSQDLFGRSRRMQVDSTFEVESTCMMVTDQVDSTSKVESTWSEARNPRMRAML